LSLPLEQAVNLLQEKINNQQTKDVARILEDFSNSEKAQLLEALPASNRETIWQLVETKAKGETLLALHRDVRKRLIQLTDEQELVQSLAFMQMDELADIDDDLPISVVEAMVDAMDAQNRQHYDEVKEYPDDSAGGLMDVDATSVRPDVTVKAVLRYLRILRSRLGQLPEHLDSLAVIDRNNLVLGVLPLSDLVSHSEDSYIKDIMSTSYPTVSSQVSADEVAKLFESKDLLSVPVINDAHELIGRITVDDVIDYMQEKSEKELLLQAGLNADSDMFGPIFTASMHRAIWLGINLVTAFIAAWIIGLFDASIEKLVALAVLMPVVASMGGVTGSQTLTIVTRGIAVGKIAKSNIGPITKHELAIASINALLWGATVFLIAFLWYGNWQLGVVFGLALSGVIIAGTLVGALLPLLLKKLGVDPAIAGGVILTTLTDAVGFFTFLAMATYFLL